MIECEYRKLFLNQHGPRGDELDLLNAAGAEGWELVGLTSNNIAYLKRQVEAPPAMTAAHARENASGNGRGIQEAVVKYRDQVTRETWSGRQLAEEKAGGWRGH